MTDDKGMWTPQSPVYWSSSWYPAKHFLGVCIIPLCRDTSSNEGEFSQSAVFCLGRFYSFVEIYSLITSYLFSKKQVCSVLGFTPAWVIRFIGRNPYRTMLFYAFFFIFLCHGEESVLKEKKRKKAKKSIAFHCTVEIEDNWRVYISHIWPSLSTVSGVTLALMTNPRPPSLALASR